MGFFPDGKISEHETWMSNVSDTQDVMIWPHSLEMRGAVNMSEKIMFCDENHIIYIKSIK